MKKQRKVFVIVLIVAILSSVLLSGCLEEEPEISVDVSPHVVKPGDDLTISVKVYPPEVTRIRLLIDGQEQLRAYTGEYGTYSRTLYIKPQASEGVHVVTVEAPDLGIVGSASFVVSVPVTPSPTFTPTPKPTPTPSPLPEPKYAPGDIIAEKPTKEDCLMTIISYDEYTDEYEINFIFRNRDGSWGHFVDEQTNWFDREYVEKKHPTLIAHVDLSTITIGEPKISPTLTPTPTPKPTPSPSPSPSPTPFPITSEVIHTSEEETVKHPSGSMIYVPRGAVPLNVAGEEGEMLFTIEVGSPEEFGVPSTPPSGWEFVGDMHSMGPEGFIFEIPITATMPLPDGFDYEQYDVRMFDYDRAAGEWMSVGGRVNDDGTALSADVLHLCANILLAQQWSGKGHGAIMFDAIPGYSFKLCIESHTLRYPEWDTRFNAENRFRSIMRRDAYGCPADGKQYWRLPQGTYTLSVEVYRHGDDPLRTPKYLGFFQKTVTIGRPHWDWQRGSHAPDYEFAVYFGDLAQWTNPDRLTPGRPPCMGTSIPSVGVGAINARLEWRAEADLDLWVIDPCNNLIFWNDTSAQCQGSLGQLDLDNQCSGIVLGRPENIFWQSNPPQGTYKVYVDYYEDCKNAGTVRYTVTWWLRGKAYSKSGTISPPVMEGAKGDEDPVTTFKY